MIRTCRPRITSQTMMKTELVKIPSKMFHSSWIFLEEIMLVTCMSTNKLKKKVNWTEAPPGKTKNLSMSSTFFPVAQSFGYYVAYQL